MTKYGFGDPQTWGAPTGHPMDPRTDDEAHERLMEEMADEVREDLKTPDGRQRIADDLEGDDVIGMLLEALAQGTTAALLTLEDDLIEAAVNARLDH
jgi:hypothetical protein